MLSLGWADKGHLNEFEGQCSVYPSIIFLYYVTVPLIGLKWIACPSLGHFFLPPCFYVCIFPISQYLSDFLSHFGYLCLSVSSYNVIFYLSLFIRGSLKYTGQFTENCKDCGSFHICLNIGVEVVLPSFLNRKLHALGHGQLIAFQKV